jgi:hypothetical protein
MGHNLNLIPSKKKGKDKFPLLACGNNGHSLIFVMPAGRWQASQIAQRKS